MPVTVILFARAIPPDFLAPEDAARRWSLEQVLQIAGGTTNRRGKAAAGLITWCTGKTDVKLGLHRFPLHPHLPSAL